MNSIEKLLSGVKGRFIRAVLSLAIGILVSKYQGNEWYISITPLLQTLGKFLRDKYPGSWEWLPF
jgi:hypothetical protein